MREVSKGFAACAAVLAIGAGSAAAASCVQPPAQAPVVAALKLSDARCTVVVLEHDSGVVEALCMTASELRYAYDLRSGRDGGCP
jgi:hypothetical protein